MLNRQLESPGLSLTLHQKAAEHHCWKEEVGYAVTWVCFGKMRQMADTTMRMNSADDKRGRGVTRKDTKNGCVGASLLERGSGIRPDLGVLQ